MKGISVCEGIAIGKPYILSNQKIEINFDKVENIQRAYQIDLFHIALKKSEQQLKELRNNAQAKVGNDEAAIFDVQLAMIEDAMFVNNIMNELDNGKRAEAAVEIARVEIENIFQNMDNDYMKERIIDINDIANRIIRNILGIEEYNISDISDEVILIAEDLTPSDIIRMSKNIKGIILETQGETSHTSIMAKVMGIPTMVSAQSAIKILGSAELVVLDTIYNEVTINPSETIIEICKKRLEVLAQQKRRLDLYVNEKAVTLDGHKVKLCANIGSYLEVNAVKENGAEGIGLFRTEFMYMDKRTFPTEEEQFNIYKNIVENVNGEVIIRTLDIGGDKVLPYYKFGQDTNPFLGYRAIRFSLDRKDIFKIQLRAILKASVYGKIKIMYPMISSVEELRSANEILEECKNELKFDGEEYSNDIKVGITIEVPSAALLVDVLANEVDFFSIGTNDLCQYTLAVDRMNKRVSYLYKPLHPAMVRLIHDIVNNSHNAGKKVAICGEMAGNPANALLLIGLGIDELSMNPNNIPMVKEIIKSSNYEDIKQISSNCLNCATADEVEAVLKKGGIRC